MFHFSAGMDCPRVRYPQLNDVVEADLAEQGYQVLTDPGQQVDKVIQLYEVRLQTCIWLSRTCQSCTADRQSTFKMTLMCITATTSGKSLVLVGQLVP